MARDLRKVRITIKTEAIKSVCRHLAAIHCRAPVRLILEGERGIGKRTSIDYALKKHPGGELVVLRGSADQFRSPLSPIAEAFSCLIEENARNDHVIRAASRVANDLAQLVPFFSTLGGRVQDLFQGHQSLGNVYPILEMGDLIFRIQKVIRALAFEFHPLLIFADIDQYDHSTLSAISQLARKEDLDCSFILTYDPYAVEPASQGQFQSFESALTTHLFFNKIKFYRFSPEQSEGYVNGLLGSGVASREQIASLHKKTGGNPLFLRELLAHLVEEGHIQGISSDRKLLDTCWTATLPDSIWDLINLKLQRLPQELRTIIDLASVIGNEFQSEPISEGLQLSHLLVLDRLRKLEMGYNLIEQMVSTHRFSLETIRDAVYESLGPALAREHHLLLVRYFERHADSPEVDYLLYYHYRRAHFVRKSIEHLIKAAYSARERFSHEEAAHRFRLAHDLLVQAREGPSEQMDWLRLEEGLAHYEAGELSLAVERLTNLASTKTGPARKTRAACLLYLSLSQYMLDDPAAALLTLNSLFSDGLSDLPEELQVRALMTRASVLYALGQWEEARRVYLRFVKAVPRGGDLLAADAVKRINMFYLPELALPLLKKTQARIARHKNLPVFWEIHHNIGCNYLLLGELQSAENYFKEALCEFDKMGTYRVTYSLNNLGLAKMFQGELAEAEDLFLQAKAIARVDFDRMSAICHLAILECLSGRPERAIPELESLCEKVRGMSERVLVEMAFHNLAWAHSLTGGYDKALLYLQESPEVLRDLWSEFRIARRQRMIEEFARGDGAVLKKENLLNYTGRRDSWSFKKLDYEVNDIWYWE